MVLFKAICLAIIFLTRIIFLRTCIDIPAPKPDIMIVNIVAREIVIVEVLTICFDQYMDC